MSFTIRPTDVPRNPIPTMAPISGMPGTGQPRQYRRGPRRLNDPHGLTQFPQTGGIEQELNRLVRERGMERQEARTAQARPQPRGSYGGYDTAYEGGLGQGNGFQSAGDPFSELLALAMQGGGDFSGQIAAGYDAQKDALLSALGPMREAGDTATGAIGDYFGYAGEQANEARGAVGETYSAAGDRVGGIYEETGEALMGLPQELVDSASRAAGGQIGSSVAGRVAASVAPFAAASEAEGGGARADLERRSAAGQNYLSQLAGATGAEGAQYQSNVESRLAMASAAVHQQAAQVEAQKAQAMAKYSADASVDQYRRMLDVMGLQLQFDKHGLAQDQHQLQREMFESGGGQSPQDIKAWMDIEERQSPYGGSNYGKARQLTGNLGTEAQTLFDQILNATQTSAQRDQGGRVLSEQELLARALGELGDYTTETETVDNSFSFLPWVDKTRTEPVGGGQVYEGNPQDLQILEEAFRIMYGNE